MSLKVIALSENKSLAEQFSKVPFILREQKYLKSMMNAEWVLKLIQHEFPFTREHWLVFDHDRVVGRIAANVSTTNPNQGYLGFYECDLSHPEFKLIHEFLISTAEQWLKKNNVLKIFGPIDYSTWFSYRFQINAVTDTPTFAWEPSQPEEYVDLWSKSGFQVYETYASLCSNHIPSGIKMTQKHYETCLAQGFHFRPFLKGEAFHAELSLISMINQSSFKDAALYEPITAEAYQEFYVSQFSHYLSDFCFFILNKEGKEVGYFFLYEDQKHFIWKTVAVVSEYQKLGLGHFGMHHGIQLALNNGIDHFVAALVKKGAPSETLTRKPAEYLWEHQYALFFKDIGH